MKAHNGDKENVRREHSSFWRASAAARSLGGQVAWMQARAAFWKFMFEQTHGRSALKNANSSSVPPETPSETVNHVLGRAASSRSSSGRAVDDAGVDADLSVGRESRGGEDEGDLSVHVLRVYRRCCAGKCDEDLCRLRSPAFIRSWAMAKLVFVCTPVASPQREGYHTQLRCPA